MTLVSAAAQQSNFVGGTLRMRYSRRAALEFTMDYRSETNPDGTARFRETPFQGSMLIYLAPGAVAPYLLGGYGVYSRKADVMDGPLVVSTVADRKTAGTSVSADHAGSPRGFFVDYRYRYVRFGRPTTNRKTSTSRSQRAQGLTSGSMWTTHRVYAARPRSFIAPFWGTISPMVSLGLLVCGWRPAPCSSHTAHTNCLAFRGPGIGPAG
jgi:hypothetical protein